MKERGRGEKLVSFDTFSLDSGLSTEMSPQEAASGLPERHCIESYLLVSWLDIEPEHRVHKSSGGKYFRVPSADEQVKERRIHTMEYHPAPKRNEGRARATTGRSLKTPR